MQKTTLLIRLLRAEQWLKNFIIFAPLIFGGQFFSKESFYKTVLAFIAFSLTASSVYIFNDFMDKKSDQLHPQKRNRIVASRNLSILQLFPLWCGLLICALGITFYTLPNQCIFILTVYLVTNMLYSTALKHIPILDVFIISFGFVIRIYMGSAASGIPPSFWLIFCTFNLSLFLGFAKRRAELISLKKQTNFQRKALKGYDMVFLNVVVVSMAAVTIISYTAYIMNARDMDFHISKKMLYSLPVVVVGMLRYNFILFRNEMGEDPVRLVLFDPILFSSCLVWLIVSIITIYL